VPQEGTQRRRRRTGAQIPQQSAASESPQEIKKIVISQSDEPEWLVSASRVSGAAERRGQTGGRAPMQERKPAPEQAAAIDEGRAILAMRKDTQNKKDMPAGAARKSASGAKKKQSRPAARQSAVPVVPKKLSKKARARRKAKMRRAALILLGSMVFCALLAAGIMGGSRLVDIKQTLDRGSNADKMPVGAQKKLRAGANQHLNSRKKR